MTKTIGALFDGKTLRPDEPLGFPPNTRLRLTIEVTEQESGQGSFLRTARALELSGPPDWSANLEAYLRGQRAHP
jgi:hypothetical protein